MYLQNLSLINFKNYQEAEIDFDKGINCIVGKNGVGKTNILDAIHYLSLTKSYFNSIDSQNIKHSEDFFIIQGNFLRESETEPVYCSVKRNHKKQFLRNKKEYSRLSEHIGRFPLVIITPEDNTLILEGSEIRRKFINNVISQYNKDYLDDIIKYNKLIADRNKYLKQIAENTQADQTYLEVIDEQLNHFAKTIFDERTRFLDEFMPVFLEIYTNLSGGREEVNLEYISHLQHNDLQKLLKQSLIKDKILGFTSQGIHKDDINFKLNGHPLKKTGSQGQQKTYLVALKLAKYMFLKKATGLTPILLLDDIFDKFDHERVTQLIQFVSTDEFNQIVITDTDTDRIEKILKQLRKDSKLFRVDEQSKINAL